MYASDALTSLYRSNISLLSFRYCSGSCIAAATLAAAFFDTSTRSIVFAASSRYSFKSSGITIFTPSKKSIIVSNASCCSSVATLSFRYGAKWRLINFPKYPGKRSSNLERIERFVSSWLNCVRASSQFWFLASMWSNCCFACISEISSSFLSHIV